ncbi:hypothetical protein, partial [Sphingobacterium thermophilum]|uniref:hypothetical protein n=1 Tax=Sphingobacterium thermophilum TaxID=768534 RepID=UPI0031EA8592
YPLRYMINILKNSPPPHLASALSLALRPLFLFLSPFLADGTAKVETLSDFPKTFLKFFFLFFLSGNKKDKLSFPYPLLPSFQTFRRTSLPSGVVQR